MDVDVRVRRAGEGRGQDGWRPFSPVVVCRGEIYKGIFVG